jgi:hypothetical protein
MKTTLILQDPRVEPFAAGKVGGPEREPAGRTPRCSTIDLCPTRPC